MFVVEQMCSQRSSKDIETFYVFVKGEILHLSAQKHEFTIKQSPLSLLFLCPNTPICIVTCS